MSVPDCMYSWKVRATGIERKGANFWFDNFSQFSLGFGAFRQYRKKVRNLSLGEPPSQMKLICY